MSDVDDESDVIDVDQSRDQVIHMAPNGLPPKRARVTCPSCHGIPGQCEDTAHPARPYFMFCPRCDGTGKIIIPIQYGEGRW